MKTLLLKELKIEKKKQFLPIIFSHTEPIDETKIKRNREYRIIKSRFHQSEIYCLRNYKDGINISTK